jgi:hypothetical protein
MQATKSGIGSSWPVLVRGQASFRPAESKPHGRVSPCSINRRAGARRGGFRRQHRSRVPERHRRGPQTTHCSTTAGHVTWGAAAAACRRLGRPAGRAGRRRAGSLSREALTPLDGWRGPRASPRPPRPADLAGRLGWAGRAGLRGSAGRAGLRGSAGRAGLRGSAGRAGLLGCAGLAGQAGAPGSADLPALADPRKPADWRGPAGWPGLPGPRRLAGVLGAGLAVLAGRRRRPGRRGRAPVLHARHAASTRPWPA